MPDLAGEPGEGAPPEQPPPLPGGQPATGRLDEGELVCEDVTKLDAGDDFCTFVRNHCKAESLVNWPQLYYCHVAPHGALLTAVMLVGGLWFLGWWWWGVCALSCGCQGNRRGCRPALNQK